MQVPRESLGQPAVEMAHRIARDLAAQAIAARERLGAEDDAEALHDFRVALRRLRSILRAYRPHLTPGLGKPVRRRLKGLAAATGESRDLEVHLAWLLDAREQLTARERIGVSWLIRRLRAKKRKADAKLGQEVAVHFASLRRRLESRLRRYALSLDLEDPNAEPRYGLVTRDLMLELGDALRQRLGEVESLADQASTHQARIRGKRLRYVLEPVAEAIPGGDDLLATLTRLQDQLGELHDAHVFGGEIAEAVHAAAAYEGRRRDPRPGLVALAGRLRDRSEQRLDELRADRWIGGDGHEFFDLVAAACGFLGRAAAPPLEIERKYLLSAVPPEATAVAALEIEQGYLPGERLLERLRRVRSPDGIACYRTVKLGSGMLRTEVEEAATPETFETMWPLTAKRRVLKRRSVVADGDLRWEIDEFTDRPLVLAEVELPSVDAEVALPKWLQPYVVEEVTGNAEYDNAVLAQ